MPGRQLSFGRRFSTRRLRDTRRMIDEKCVDSYQLGLTEKRLRAILQAP